MVMKDFSQLADRQTIDKTIEALKTNGINASFAETSGEAKEEVLKMIPDGAEVMTMSSTTLGQVGLDEEINKSESKYNPVRDRLYAMDKNTQAQEMNKLGAAPQYALGSVHAVTQDGNVLIASNTGSQLPAYVYGALNVIWVVGAQKIVENIDKGMKRINEYVLPLESERANKAYNITSGSFVSKLLIINREISPGRITLILVNEKLGF